MDDASRPTLKSLIRHLEQEPWKFDFFQAVYLLKALSPTSADDWSSAPAHAAPGALEVFQIPSLGLDAASVAGIRMAAGKPVLHIRGFGLFGSNGALPLWLTDFAIRQKLEWINNRPSELPERLQPGEQEHPFWTEAPFGAFCHLLQNRFLEMVYQAWETHHKAPALARRSAGYSRNPLGRSFFAFTGLLPHLLVDARRHAGVDDQAGLDRRGDADIEVKPPRSPYGHLADLVAFFSGRLTGMVRHPEGLTALLEHQYRLPVEIQECRGCWIEVPPANLWQLGEGNPDAGDCSNQIFGIAGKRFFDYQMKFLIRLGPMPLAVYLAFFHDSPESRRLADIVSIYVGGEFGWELQLVLDRQEVPPFLLPEAEVMDSPLRLGQTTWLNPALESTDGQPFCRPKAHPDDVVVEPELEWNWN